MERVRIIEVLKTPPTKKKITVCGWVRTFRNDRFLAVNDGSTINNLQLVIQKEDHDENLLKQLNTGAAISAEGVLVDSQGAGQTVELQVSSLELLGGADPDEFPIQMKRHSLEFLREKAHLRFRTNTFSAVFRIRHLLQFAIHKFFHEEGFYQLHTPIITGSDAEGAGEMFKVTTLDLDNIPQSEDGSTDYSQDFFGKPSNLTVSGQLEAELGAMALGQVYTFGPTFRAEKSNTSRHLAEFWMIEPEIAFADLNDDMALAERCLKYVLRYVLEQGEEDLAFLENRQIQSEKQLPQKNRSDRPLREMLRLVVDSKFVHMTYTEVIDTLIRSKPYKKKKFKFPVKWGVDLQSEHERWLVEKHVGGPVIVTDYPSDIKAFYMRANDDGKTVAAMDVLVPGIGELIGGSQREERLDILKKKCADFDIPEEHVWWYLETRKFGSAKHCGFGMGFERLVMYVTGMNNIRDVIPFPRTPLSVEF
ncbi:MAG: asparagine--tRNA ligase [Crocinitomicaceae bacterium]|nr:asparagine--tRNA ligase [Crocinitomicaceae bacterium]|tara:strand:- start:10164 stop:11594 length:1431 start_codon:yes stop_codon:yes gene_type:complete